MLRELIDKKGKKMILALLEEAHEPSKEHIYKPVLTVMVQTNVKSFCTGRADELLDDKMYKLAES